MWATESFVKSSASHHHYHYHHHQTVDLLAFSYPIFMSTDISISLGVFPSLLSLEFCCVIISMDSGLLLSYAQRIFIGMLLFPLNNSQQHYSALSFSLLRVYILSNCALPCLIEVLIFASHSIILLLSHLSTSRLLSKPMYVCFTFPLLFSSFVASFVCIYVSFHACHTFHQHQTP